jgi:hypothetical protein
MSLFSWLHKFWSDNINEAHQLSCYFTHFSPKFTELQAMLMQDDNMQHEVIINCQLCLTIFTLIFQLPAQPEDA